MRTLRTDRLLLRPWEPDDASFLLDLHSRWEVARWLGSAPAVMTSIDEARASVERRRALDHPVHGVWALETLTAGAPSGRLVGNVLLKPLPWSAGHGAGAPEDVEVGWHLHPDAWGHGYATEAARALLDDGFARGLPRAVAVVYPQNVASLAVCRRLGMRPLGRTDAYYDVEMEAFEALPQ